MGLWDLTFWGNSLGTWLISLLVGVVVFAVLCLLKRLLVRRIVSLAVRTKTGLDDLIVDIFKRSWVLVLLAISLWAASMVLNVHSAGFAIQIILWALVLLQLAILGNGLIGYFVGRWSTSAREKGDTATAAAYKTLGVLGRIVLWAVIVLLVLDSIPGVEVNTLIASLGIGGIAVALAVQTVLSDMFASVSILLDKPFEVGDFINVDDCSGTVEYIGLKSTRLRSLTGEQVVFGNSDLLGSRVRNYKRMQDRRVSFTIGVVYQTSYEQLVSIPKMLEEIVTAQPETEFIMAYFANYGDSSLNFEVVYKMLTADYNTYIQVRQAINLEMFRRFAEEGIQFAYPTQTVYLNKSSVIAGGTEQGM